jgi:hypothetical protein
MRRRVTLLDGTLAQERRLAMNQYVRWRRDMRSASIGLMFISLLLICSLSACADAGGTTVSASGATPPATASTPTATPLGGIIPQTSAVLGGSVFAFDKKFGANNCCFENGWTYQGPYGKMWTGVYTGGPDSMTTMDESSTQRVVGVEDGGAMYAEMSWKLTQAQSICGSFLPPDAKYHNTTFVLYDAVNVTGIEAHYTSVSLANTLPATAFTDAKGQLVPQGTFSIYYEYSFNGPDHNSINRCTMGTDEQWVEHQP